MFSKSEGTSAISFAVGGPSGPAIASDQSASALNAQAPGGVLIPVRVADAVNLTDAINLETLIAILQQAGVSVPAKPPIAVDPMAVISAL